MRRPSGSSSPWLTSRLRGGEPVADLPAPVVPVIGIVGHSEEVADLLPPGGLDRIRGGESLLLHFQAPLGNWKYDEGIDGDPPPMWTAHPDRSSGGKAPGGSVRMMAYVNPEGVTPQPGWLRETALAKGTTRG